MRGRPGRRSSSPTGTRPSARRSGRPARRPSSTPSATSPRAGGGGHGLLIVDGSFEATGDFEWNGLVIVRAAPGREGDLELTMSGSARVNGAVYVHHEADRPDEVVIGGRTTPRYTLWSPDDVEGNLRYYTFGGDDAGTIGIEGRIEGLAGNRGSNGDRTDMEALAFGPRRHALRRRTTRTSGGPAGTSPGCTGSTRPSSTATRPRRSRSPTSAGPTATPRTPTRSTA